MSTKYLGDAFDIHGGGVDLVFPHHENELAQARDAGKPFARYWIHNGLLTVNGEKMSKSLGNYITVEDALGDFPHPDYLKLFFLKTHYRSPIDYSRERIEEAKRNWHEFARFFQHAYQRKIDQVSGARGTVEAGKGLVEFQHAMDDDLNTPKALAVLFELVNAGHRMLESADKAAQFAAHGAFEVLLQCGRALGLFQQGLSEEQPEALQRIQARIAEREVARKAKDFKRADEIRESLRGEGYLLTDTAGGTLWRRAG
jgi:cysteinyl-tRNA synthetase